MTVFVDTSAFLAYLDRKDKNNSTAVNILKSLRHEYKNLICTNYVLLESIALIQNRLGLPALQDFQEAVLPLLTIIWVDAALHDLGITAVLTANRRQLSLVDCTSFAVCRQRGIQQVFAFDPHFAEQGFSLLE